jgi:hypothetical protein
VEHVRRTGQTVSGQQMLTDKFRWASSHVNRITGSHSMPNMSQCGCSIPSGASR